MIIVDFITQLFLGVDDKVRREIDKPSAYFWEGVQ